MDKLELLKAIHALGGETNEHPFIETGNVEALRELERDGLVKTLPGNPPRIVRLTPKGRAAVLLMAEDVRRENCLDN